MRKIIYTGLVFSVLLLLSCRSKNENCSTLKFQELYLYPVNCSLKIPEYKITDSIRYDLQTELNYSISSIDSFVNIICFIKSYDKQPDAKLDINTTMMFERDEVKYNRKSVQLLKDTISRINSVDIGYLKYLVEMPSEKFYEGRICFYRGRKLVTIWIFEKYKNDKHNKLSTIDCIYNAIKIN